MGRILQDKTKDPKEGIMARGAWVRHLSYGPLGSGAKGNLRLSIV